MRNTKMRDPEISRLKENFVNCPKRGQNEIKETLNTNGQELEGLKAINET